MATTSFTDAPGMSLEVRQASLRSLGGWG